MSLPEIRMRAVGLAAAACLATASAWAQYPGLIANKDKDATGPQFRSVAVVEWTGDLAHPTASRLVPVSVFDGQELQDGGIYLARPQPLALDGDVEYELETNGKFVGLFDIHGAARQQDEWIGQGEWRPMPAPKAEAQASKQKVEVEDEGSGQPVLHRKHHADDKSAGGDAGKGEGSSAPPPDDDRPRLHKAGDASQSAGSKAPAADSDRPKLVKKHDDEAGDAGSGAVDPDRPLLKRGKPAGYGAAVAPTLMGMPAEMRQQAAVSDARPAKDHPWEYTWADAGDDAKMKAALEEIARKELGLSPSVAAAVPATAPKKTTAVARRKAAKASPAPPPPPAPLEDEQFRVFELAYGSGATLVFSARTGGEAGQQKFITLIAQPDLYGGVAVLLKNVTDTAHLDVTPRMRLIDAVDAEADNRGELLFELRGQTWRQFALYRVLRGQATRLFVTGTSYWGVMGE